MGNYPYQKTIVVNNELINKVAHKERTEVKFLRAIDWEYISYAQQVLTGNELDLLIYILKWAGKGYYEFSPAGVEIETQMSDSTAQRALKRLIEIGFIKQLEGYKNRYEIDLCPEGIKERAELEKARKILHRDDKNKKKNN